MRLRALFKPANIDRSATGVAGLGGGLHRRIDGFAQALEH